MIGSFRLKRGGEKRRENKRLERKGSRLIIAVDMADTKRGGKETKRKLKDEKTKRKEN
jgi:hypothetical protein